MTCRNSLDCLYRSRQLVNSVTDIRKAPPAVFGSQLPAAARERTPGLFELYLFGIVHSFCRAHPLMS
jgi:hypothetical protein